MKKAGKFRPFLFACVKGLRRHIAPCQCALRPDFAKGIQQFIDVTIAMHGRWRDPQPLGSTGHRRIVDRLDIDAVIVHQPVADEFALMRVAYHYRNDVAGIGDMGNTHPVQRAAHFCNAGLMLFPLGIAGFQMLDAGASARSDRGRNGG